ncbi:uncharacterized protein [Solanum lycopersicum]|uniref:uncharacterized protein n=1 Tax=Solanum lycopersicum TaxID=4081 RepID=UPI0002BC8B81|nr:uncharacterized protein LOC101255235 [Solanum lycopersicum]
MITAEIPDMELYPDGYKAVKNYMMHGPCGDLNPGCPCMKQGKCTKHFPKKFNNQTNFDADGFPIYRRRNTETILLKIGKSLKDIHGMPFPDSTLMNDIGNHLINEELEYDKGFLKEVHDKSFALLNDCQKIAYEAVIKSVVNEEGRLFFINGHGGTGKTFLWNTIIFRLRSESKIVLPVATSGIAAFADKPFGGLTIIFGGDFRQILPVIPKGTRADILDASLNSSCLWPFFKIYELKQNMRLCCGRVSDSEAAEVTTFDKWLLQIGDGSFYSDVDNDLIKVPTDICIMPSNDPIGSIIDAVYPSLLQKYSDPTYLQERAILTPKNEMVHELNDKIMKMIQGEGRTYFSSDNVCKASVNTNDEDLLYPKEFLNSLRFPGIPNIEVQLKVGTPVILLRNQNQSEGLCNGTRLVVTHLGNWSISANIISEKNIG